MGGSDSKLLPDRPSGSLPWGRVILKNRKSGKVLNVSGASDANGANVIQWDNPESPESQWWLDRAHDDFRCYHLRNWKSNRFLNVCGASHENGANVHQWGTQPCNDRASHWVIRQVPGEQNRWFTLMNDSTGKYLNVSGGSRENGANVQQWEGSPDSGHDHQWEILFKVEKAAMLKAYSEAELAMFYDANEMEDDLKDAIAKIKHEQTRIKCTPDQPSADAVIAKIEPCTMAGIIALVIVISGVAIAITAMCMNYEYEWHDDLPGGGKRVGKLKPAKKD